VLGVVESVTVGGGVNSFDDSDDGEDSIDAELTEVT
jgi:hypothetical protein